MYHIPSTLAGFVHSVEYVGFEFQNLKPQQKTKEKEQAHQTQNMHKRMLFPRTMEYEIQNPKPEH